MKQRDAATRTNVLRDLPSVDELVRTPTGSGLIEKSGQRRVTGLARRVIESLRKGLLANGGSSGFDLLAEAEKRLVLEVESERWAGVNRVINATGVVIHTNLGRAPLSEAARRAVVEERRPVDRGV